MLFTDGSVNNQTKIGIGAALLIQDTEFQERAPCPMTFQDAFSHRVVLKQFHPTSSTKLELQTLLWSLSELVPPSEAIRIHTDSQNILSLPGRRQRLPHSHYLSRKQQPIANADMYREFYALTDKYDYQLIKLAGHPAPSARTAVDWVFALVDSAARTAIQRG